MEARLQVEAIGAIEKTIGKRKRQESSEGEENAQKIKPGYCQLCSKPLTKGIVVECTTQNHKFHRSCLQGWFIMTNDTKCPVYNCKQNLHHLLPEMIESSNNIEDDLFNKVCHGKSLFDLNKRLENEGFVLVTTSGQNSKIYIKDSKVVKIKRERFTPWKGLEHAQAINTCYSIILKGIAKQHIPEINQIVTCMDDGTYRVMIVMKNAGLVNPRRPISDEFVRNAAAKISQTRLISTDVLQMGFPVKVNTGNVAFKLHDDHLSVILLDIDDIERFVLVKKQNIPLLTRIYVEIIYACFGKEGHPNIKIEDMYNLFDPENYTQICKF